MFIAYLDESGTHDQSKFASLAGLVDRENGWAAFEERWKALLARYRVDEFHMADFESRHGEFEWRNYWFLPDEELRHPFLTDLIQAIDTSRRLRVGVTLSLSDYHELVPESLQARYHPYYFLLAKVVEDLWRVSFLKLPPGEQLVFVFDQKMGFQGRSENIFSALKENLRYSEKMAGVEFKSSRVVVPLQAADLMAFEYRKYGEMLVLKTGRQPRWPMVQLCKGRGLFHHIIRASLADWVTRQHRPLENRRGV